MSTILNLAFIDSFGGMELLMVAFIAFMLFGGRNLPGFARTLGRTYREFKRASGHVEREIRRAIDESPDEDAPKHKAIATPPQARKYTAPPAPISSAQLPASDETGQNAEAADKIQKAKEQAPVEPFPANPLSDPTGLKGPANVRRIIEPNDL